MDINAVYREAILGRLKDVTATDIVIERLDNTFVIDIDDKLDPLMEIRRRLPLSPFIWTFDRNASDVCADSASHSNPSTDSFAATETTPAAMVTRDSPDLLSNPAVSTNESSLLAKVTIHSVLHMVFNLSSGTGPMFYLIQLNCSLV